MVRTRLRRLFRRERPTAAQDSLDGTVAVGRFEGGQLFRRDGYCPMVGVPFAKGDTVVVIIKNGRGVQGTKTAGNTAFLVNFGEPVR